MDRTDETSPASQAQGTAAVERPRTPRADALLWFAFLLAAVGAVLVAGGWDLAIHACSDSWAGALWTGVALAAAAIWVWWKGVDRSTGRRNAGRMSTGFLTVSVAAAGLGAGLLGLIALGFLAPLWCTSW